MAIRNVTSSSNNEITQPSEPTKASSPQVESPHSAATAPTPSDLKANTERLQTQFVRSRNSIGSTQVQQQIKDNFSLPFPLPLPLPRIPTPAAMIDFTKLVSVLSTSILDGVKNFGLSGIKFGVSLAEALGNGALSMKEGIDGLIDLTKGGLANINSSVKGFTTDSGRALSRNETAINKLASSSNPAANSVAKAATTYNSEATTALNGLKSALSEYSTANDLATKRLIGGIETFAAGMIKMVTASSEGIGKMQDGQTQMMRALSDMAVANQGLAASAGQSLQALASAKDKLNSATQNSLSKLSGDDLKQANAILKNASGVATDAGRLQSKTNSATQNLASSANEFGKSLTLSINGTWGKIAQAAQDLTGNLTGVNETSKQFISDTSSFRSTIAAAQKGDKQAVADLKSKWGYTLDTLPKPGTMFVDPNYMKGELVNGQPTATNFPTGKASSTPLPLEQQLFGNGKTVTLTNADGSTTVVKNMADYQKIVAAQRANVLGVKNDEGKPMQVHLALEGGGGEGKRFAPAIAEMYKMGAVPASASGTSVGAIGAALVASGADPKQIETIINDDRISKFLDLHVGGNAGVFKGEEAFKFLDQTLRQLTGITDRPVTFADLKIPLHIVAAKYSDSQPPPGQDMSSWDSRKFIFGPETTPNTPVAVAVRASMAIPGVFDPVEMVDPTTGRTIQLTDGGSLDNLPLGYNKDGLPTVGLNLNEPNTNNPKALEYNLPKLPAPKGNLYASNPLLNTLYGGLFIAGSGGLAQDLKDRTQPPANTFILSVPVWDLTNPKFADDGLEFKYDPVVDKRIDGQTRDVTQNFFRQFFNDLHTPGASGTNIKPLPTNTSFSREFDVKGQHWTASYAGQGGTVNFKAANGTERTIFVGENKLQNWEIDDAAFGDLSARLKLALDGSLT